MIRVAMKGYGIRGKQLEVGSSPNAHPGHERIEWPGLKRNLSRSATRALDVLDYMAALGRPLRAVEVASGMELNPSSANQLLKTMADSGYLIFDPRLKLYHPSPRLSRFRSEEHTSELQSLMRNSY